MFYDTDQSEQNQFEQQFTYFQPTNAQLNKQKTPLQSQYQIFNCCQKLKNQILDIKIHEKSKQIVNLVTSNMKLKSKYYQKYKINHQQIMKCKKSLITSVQIYKNQVQHLPLFSQKLIQLLKKQQQRINLKVQQISQKQVRDIILKMYLILTKNKKNQNSFIDHQDISESQNQFFSSQQRIDTNNIEKQQKKIELNQQSHIKQQQPQIIFVVTKITDLDCNNFYLFQKALEQLKYSIIIPTFSNLQTYVFDKSIKQSQIQAHYYNFFNAKDLFTEYMFKCLSSKHIKAYLPKQVLSLISDYDYYPLSFEEGARRLVFCIERSYLINNQERIYVQFEDLVNAIETPLKLIMNLGVQQIDYRHQQNIIKCILDQKYLYTISNGYIGKALKFDIDLTQDILIDKIKKQIINSFRKNQRLKVYDTVFQNEITTGNQFRKSKKNSRSQKLGIRPEFYKSKRDKFYDQLNYIIKKETEYIRKQALLVQWRQIKFQHRIIPQIPRIISEAIQIISQKHKLIKEVFSSHYSIAIEDILSHISIQSLQKGQLMYIIKDFELCGLIEKNRKSLKVSYLNNYFEKSQFSK